MFCIRDPCVKDQIMAPTTHISKSVGSVVRKFKIQLSVLIFMGQIVYGSTCCEQFRRELFKITARNEVKLFWNIPTFQCDYHKLNFTGLARKYRISQNDNGRFTGNVINILYDPGSFPAILQERTTTIMRNGGVPQRGNLSYHLELFSKVVNETMDENYSGVAVIDFESWRPVFRQNFGALSSYKNVSIAIERRAHPFWSNFLIEREAKRKFEFYGQLFMEETLYYAKKLRKNATWGFYAYPYCFNMSPSNMKTHCPAEVVKENDDAIVLYEAPLVFIVFIAMMTEFLHHWVTESTKAQITGLL